MNNRSPHPALLQHLCDTYGHHNRADIVACFQNADRAWRDIPPELIEHEPMLITARAFRVRSVFARTLDERAWANSMESLILHPYRSG